MKIIKHIIMPVALATFGALTQQAVAETVRWVISPVYDSITRLSDDLYKVSRSRVVSVIDVNGATVVTAADSITPFTDGQALILDHDPDLDDDRMLLKGILRPDKSIASITDDIYVSDYPFFSEGLLPVTLKNGSAGYIDINGTVVIPFDYADPHPFSGGLAAVSKKKGFFKKSLKKVSEGIGAKDIVGKDKVMYINRSGRALKLDKEIGDIYFGSTFKDGEALVINKNRQYCFINTQGRKVRIEPSVTLRFDESNALTDLDDSAPAVSLPRRPDGPDVYTEGTAIGYRKGDKVVVPAQFDNAEPFVDRRAIASRDSRRGVLALVDGQVTVEIKKGALAPTGPDMQSLDCVIALPQEYNRSEIELVVTDKANNVLSRIPDAADGSGRHTVSLMIPKDYHRIRLMAANVELWNSGMAGSPSKESASSDESVGFVFAARSAKANAKDVASITLTVANNSDREISGPLTVKGAGGSVKKFSVSPGARRTVTLVFANVTKKETRTVTVTLNGVSVTRRITLEPFFNF